MFGEASCGQMAQNCILEADPPIPSPPFTPNTNSASLFGAFQRRRREEQHVNPPLVPPRALCRAERLNCVLQVGPQMAGLESPESPCGAAGKNAEKRSERAVRVFDGRGFTPTIRLPRLAHSAVLADVDQMSRRPSRWFTPVS